jgi:hypothetical protein
VRHGKTAVYTILKNEIKYIEKWLYYAKDYDYRVLLDTGSTDGSWELLNKMAKSDPGLLINQCDIKPWRFDVARNYNMTMIPEDVVWALSPDLDEYYSINTLEEMERIIDAVPDITCIASDRLDIYSRTVRVGPPNFLPTNKIHLRKDYRWKERIYEHISWIHKDRYEKELYSDDIFLIHDQDFRKSERSPLYVKLMEEEWNENPLNTWNNWFLLYYYYNSKQFEKYLPVVCNYVKYHTKHSDNNFQFAFNDLVGILHNMPLNMRDRDMVEDAIKTAKTIHI